mgnify:CR=1 FL=1
MATNISAEEGALRDGANAVADTKASIDRRIAAIRSQIEEMRSYWTGAAAVSFGQMVGTWDEKARKLNEVLVTLEDALRGTERDQAASEESHQQTIAGLGSMMGS